MTPPQTNFSLWYRRRQYLSFSLPEITNVIFGPTSWVPTLSRLHGLRNRTVQCCAQVIESETYERSTLCAQSRAVEVGRRRGDRLAPAVGALLAALLIDCGRGGQGSQVPPPTPPLNAALVIELRRHGQIRGRESWKISLPEFQFWAFEPWFTRDDALNSHDRLFKAPFSATRIQ